MSSEREIAKFNRATDRKEPRPAKSELQKAAQRLVENNENQLHRVLTQRGKVTFYKNCTSLFGTS